MDPSIVGVCPRPRNPRACEQCRHSKVRCLQSDEAGICQKYACISTPLNLFYLQNQKADIGLLLDVLPHKKNAFLEFEQKEDRKVTDSHQKSKWI